MVAMLDGNELILLRRTLGMIIVPNKSDRAVDGIGATQREVNMVQIARRQFGQPGGQPDGRIGAQPEIARRIGQFAQLSRGCINDAVLSVPGIDTPQAGEAVEQLMARDVGQRRALR